MLKGAIFDLDGTLVDSMFIWQTAGERYLGSLGIKPGKDLELKLKEMSLPQAAEYMRSAYGLSLTAEDIVNGVNGVVEDFYFNKVEPKEGVVPFLEELKARGVKMCVASATARYEVAAALKRNDMDRFFVDILSCSDLGLGKGDPAIFREALKILGTAKNETLVFEDSLHALKTAAVDGFPTVAVYDRYEKQQDELRAIADCFLSDYTNTEDFWKFASTL